MPEIWKNPSNFDRNISHLDQLEEGRPHTVMVGDTGIKVEVPSDGQPLKLHFQPDGLIALPTPAEIRIRYGGVSDALFEIIERNKLYLGIGMYWLAAGYGEVLSYRTEGDLRNWFIVGGETNEVMHKGFLKLFKDFRNIEAIYRFWPNEYSELHYNIRVNVLELIRAYNCEVRRLESGEITFVDLIIQNEFFRRLATGYTKVLGVRWTPELIEVPM